MSRPMTPLFPIGYRAMAPTPPTAAPRLFWSMRPRRLACPCGRKPLLGYLDAQGEHFLCGACEDWKR